MTDLLAGTTPKEMLPLIVWRCDNYPVCDPKLEPRQRAIAEAADWVRAIATENAALRQAILDIDAHATPYGDIPDEPGWVGTYLVTAGALHRALGKIGHTAPMCAAEAEVAALRQDLEEYQRLLDQPSAMHTYRQGIHQPDCAACQLLAKVRTALHETRELPDG